MIAFLDKIADRLLKKFPETMEGVLVVLPSKRAVVFLKQYLSKKIKKPIFLPEFYSVEEYVEQVSGLTVLDNISLQFRLYRAYLKNAPKKSDSFDEFMNWSNVLLHDFNEIDRNLADAEAIPAIVPAALLISSATSSKPRLSILSFFLSPIDKLYSIVYLFLSSNSII